VTGSFQNSSEGGEKGRFPVFDPFRYDTTDLAAVAAWEILQGFYSALPQLDSKVKSKEFNLWTESYGGHYGPAFFDYFRNKNLEIENGTSSGTQLLFNTLGVSISPAIKCSGSANDGADR
jgi:hypothetical protein